MRTVVFSDPETAARVNENFVCAWVNKEPQRKFPSDVPLDVPVGYALGNGATNITAIFATPDGTVLHAVPGYLDAVAFAAEMKFVLDLRARILKSDMKLVGGALGVFREAHTAEAKVKDRGQAGKAHEKLAKAGFLKIDQITFTYFNDLVPPVR